jgi:hypothetical protein
MSDAVTDGSPEIRKLAHQLGVAPSRLEFLAGVPQADLRELRGLIGEYLFQADRHHFSKVVAVSKIVPTALAAKVTEHALTPLIAARTAELLEPAKAVDMVGRLPDQYLADVSAAMDPARAPEVIANIPPAQVAKVGAELARRGEWVVMGGFVSLVSDAALRSSVEDLSGEQLLRVGYVLDDLSRLDDVADMLTDDQLDDMLGAAIAHDLWRELDGVLVHLTGSQAQRIACRYAEAPSPVTAAVEDAVRSGALSEAGLAALRG